MAYQEHRNCVLQGNDYNARTGKRRGLQLDKTQVKVLGSVVSSLGSSGSREPACGVSLPASHTRRE